MSAFSGARYVFLGEPRGCGKYWFAADLVSVAAP